MPNKLSGNCSNKNIKFLSSSSFEWNDLATYLKSTYSKNLGIYVYGSVLFESIEMVNDIDIVVLTRSKTRKRLVQEFNQKEMHINLLSKEIFLKDLIEGSYGEYYVNKIMNPYCLVRGTEDLSEIFMQARKIKIIQSLVFASPMISSFSVQDLISFITCLRIFQFPHYLASAITMLSNKSSNHFITFKKEYLITLQTLVSEGLLASKGQNKFILNRNQIKNQHANSWSRFLKIIPLYWRTFTEIHRGGYEEIETYLTRRAEKLKVAIKNFPMGFQELISNYFIRHMLKKL